MVHVGTCWNPSLVEMKPSELNFISRNGWDFFKKAGFPWDFFKIFKKIEMGSLKFDKS